jgi:hypothetical protein
MNDSCDSVASATVSFKHPPACKGHAKDWNTIFKDLGGNELNKLLRSDRSEDAHPLCAALFDEATKEKDDRRADGENKRAAAQAREIKRLFKASNHFWKSVHTFIDAVDFSKLSEGGASVRKRRVTFGREALALARSECDNMLIVLDRMCADYRVN